MPGLELLGSGDAFVVENHRAEDVLYCEVVPSPGDKAGSVEVVVFPVGG